MVSNLPTDFPIKVMLNVIDFKFLHGKSIQYDQFVIGCLSILFIVLNFHFPNLSNIFHFRNQNKILMKELLSLPSVQSSLKDPNALGLTPFACLFWVIGDSSILIQLQDKGANTNVRFCTKPMSYLESGYKAEFRMKKEFR